MSTPIAYFNGEFIPADEAAVPVYDAGFMLGTTVAEQLRTFNGQLFQLDRHLDRLFRSLELVDVDPGIDRDEFASIAQRVASHNHGLIQPGDDVGLSTFVTPGTYATFSSMGSTGPLVCMHTYLQPFHLWADKYESGQSLVITDVRQVPDSCWSPELKCRSRMHYYLAEKRARELDPKSRALLLDSEGFVSEASTASLVIYREGEGFIAPPIDKILPGISLAVLKDLAAQQGFAFKHEPLKPDDVATADEVMLCSTSPCVVPVVRLNGSNIHDGKPGEAFRNVLSAWCELVQVDIPEQATRFARRS